MHTLIHCIKNIPGKSISNCYRAVIIIDRTLVTGGMSSTVHMYRRHMRASEQRACVCVCVSGQETSQDASVFTV